MVQFPLENTRAQKSELICSPTQAALQNPSWCRGQGVDHLAGLVAHRLRRIFPNSSLCVGMGRLGVSFQRCSL